MGAVVVWWVCVVVWGQSERNGMLLLRRGRPHQFITAAAAERSRNRAGNRRHRGGREGGRERGREGERSLLTSPLGFDLRSVVVVDWRARNRLRSAAGKEGRTRQAGMMDG
jgi:hypothetical protein